MADREFERQEALEEADSFTGGPGVVATKRQARGALSGIAVGVVVGALLGLIAGLIAGEVVVAVIVGAVGGSVVGGVAGGGQRAKRNPTPSGADK